MEEPQGGMKRAIEDRWGGEKRRRKRGMGEREREGDAVGGGGCLRNGKPPPAQAVVSQMFIVKGKCPHLSSHFEKVRQRALN